MSRRIRRRPSNSIRQIIDHGFRFTEFCTENCIGLKLSELLFQVQMGKTLLGISARHGIAKVNGGREGRPIGAYELAKVVEELGAGEILLNCIDCDGQGKGFDIDLIKLISEAVSIPVIASSGAGELKHFSEVFHETNASAGLAAGIFHRKEVPIQAVKEHLLQEGMEVS